MLFYQEEYEEVVVARGSRVVGSAVQVINVNARETLTAANGWDAGVMQRYRDRCNRVFETS